jgi:hypothetical protein
MALEKQALPVSQLMTRLAPIISKLGKVRNIMRLGDGVDVASKAAKGARTIKPGSMGFSEALRSAVEQVKKHGFKGVAKWGRQGINAGPIASQRIKTIGQAQRASHLYGVKNKVGITGKPVVFMQKGFGEIARTVRHPFKSFKESLQHIDKKTVSISKAKGRTPKNIGPTIKGRFFGFKTKGKKPRLFEEDGQTKFKTIFGRKKNVVGFTPKGDAIIKRNVGGKAVTLAMTGSVFGAQEYRSKTDLKGKPLTKGQRRGRALKETALWTAAPTFTGTALLGRMGIEGGQFINKLVKQSEVKNTNLKDLGFKKTTTKLNKI